MDSRIRQRFRAAFDGIRQAGRVCTGFAVAGGVSLCASPDGPAAQAATAPGLVSPWPALGGQWPLLALAALGLAAGYALHRYRLARRAEIERLRTRIAADLHDDIGANLSGIAVVSEVLSRKVGGHDPQLAASLSSLAAVSRETVEAMSDIVWAVNPQHDCLRHLTRRMRRFASEILPANLIEFRFRAPESGHDLSLDAETRRQVFLIFKESVNNLARHSHGTRAEIELRLEGGLLVLCVSDDGRGFDPVAVGEGNGLPNLRRRARGLGGELQIASRQTPPSPADASVSRRGTTLTLRVPCRLPPHQLVRRWAVGGVYFYLLLAACGLLTFCAAHLIR